MQVILYSVNLDVLWMWILELQVQVQVQYFSNMHSSELVIDLKLLDKEDTILINERK